MELTDKEKIDYIKWGLKEYKDLDCWENECTYIEHCLKTEKLDIAIKVLDFIHDAILDRISAES